MLKLYFCFKKSKRSAEKKLSKQKAKENPDKMDLEENQTPKEGTSSGNEENTYITFSEDIVQLVNSGGQVCHYE